jgi:hypothetical protein
MKHYQKYGSIVFIWCLLFVKVKGGTHKGNHGIGMVWNIMDRETFKEAAINAHGITPNKVYTDSLRHYNSGIAKNFPDAERITNCGIMKGIHKQ